MWAALSGIVSKAVTILGVLMTLEAFVGPFIALQLSRDTRIGFGISVFFAGALWMLVEARKEREKLQAQLTPKLTILFEPGEPYEQASASSRKFLIAVQNDGIEMIDDVKVYLNKIEPMLVPKASYLPMLPAELSLSSDDPVERKANPKKSTLRSGERDRILIASKWEGQGQHADEIKIWYGDPHAVARLPCGRYELTISAMGRNTSQSPPKTFVIDVDGAGRLHFGPVEIS